MQNGNDLQYREFSGGGWVVRDRGTTSTPCPRCGGPLYRVPRRLVDRLFSFRRHRFQCQAQACTWEGNLPIEPLESRP